MIALEVDEVGTEALPFDMGPAACRCGNPDFAAGCPECLYEHGEPEALAPFPRRLAFVVYAEPVAMPRPRVAVRGGKPHGYIPTHAAQAGWEIRQQATEALGDAEPFSGPVAVEVTVYIRQPASIPKRDRLTAMPTRRPDLDNYCKLALDGCSPLWVDDSQVVELVARKRYAVDSPPRWSITVEQLP